MGEAADGLKALQQIREMRPNVTLADLTMPGLDGIDFTARVVAERLPTCVVIVSMHTREDYVLRAVRAGARGYLQKDSAPTELAVAVGAAASGRTYLCPAADRLIVLPHSKMLPRNERPNLDRFGEFRLPRRAS